MTASKGHFERTPYDLLTRFSESFSRPMAWE